MRVGRPVAATCNVGRDSGEPESIGPSISIGLLTVAGREGVRGQAALRTAWAIPHTQLPVDGLRDADEATGSRRGAQAGRRLRPTAVEAVATS